jgi:hypothetical protein
MDRVTDVLFPDTIRHKGEGKKGRARTKSKQVCQEERKQVSEQRKERRK